MSRIPRDLSGKELVRLLSKYGYHVTRQTGSHLRLVSKMMDHNHHLTIPAHKPLRVGTLNSIIGAVAFYLQMEKDELISALFEDNH